MTDIRLVQQADFPKQTEVSVDWALLADGTLDERDILANAVIVALGTDRLAERTDVLPDPDSTDRRGWWGDLETEQVWQGWPIGCRLWLLKREKITGPGAAQGSLLVRVERYIREALQPFIDQRYASRMDVYVEQVGRERIYALIQMYRGPELAVDLRYQVLWVEHEEAARPRALVAAARPLMLAELTLTNSNIPENSIEGTVVGTVQGMTADSVLTLTDDAEGRFKLLGTVLVAGAVQTDYEEGVVHPITVTETLGTASNTPRHTTFNIVVADVPDMVPATGVADGVGTAEATGASINAAVGTAAGTSLATAAISGGITPAAGNASAVGVATATGRGVFPATGAAASTTGANAVGRAIFSAAGSASATGMADSPGGGLELVLSWVSDEHDLDPDFELNYANGAPAVADDITISVYTNAGLSALYDSDNNVLDAGEVAAGSISFAGLTTLVAGGEYWIRATMVRGGTTYTSNTVTKAMEGGSAVAASGSASGVGVATGVSPVVNNRTLRVDGSFSLRTDGSKRLRAQ